MGEVGAAASSGPLVCAEQFLQGSDGKRNSACFPSSIPGMRLCRIPSTFRQGWEESVGSLGEGESPPDMVQLNNGE